MVLSPVSFMITKLEHEEELRKVMRLTPHLQALQSQTNNAARKGIASLLSIFRRKRVSNEGVIETLVLAPTKPSSALRHSQVVAPRNKMILSRDEVLLIVRLVQNKKLSIDQAEELLSVLQQ